MFVHGVCNALDYVGIMLSWASFTYYYHHYYYILRLPPLLLPLLLLPLLLLLPPDANGEGPCRGTIQLRSSGRTTWCYAGSAGFLLGLALW